MRADIRLLLSVVTVLVAVGCGDEDTAGFSCADPVSTSTESADRLGVSGEYAYTTALAIVAAANGGATEVEWKVVYSLSNLDAERICVHDVAIDFPEVSDQNGRVLALNAIGGSRVVDVFRSNQQLESEQPAASQRPPFAIAPGATVLARFHQYFRLTLDGQPVPLKTSDNLAQYLGPLFGLPVVEGGAYQCVPEYTQLQVTTTSSAGTAVHPVANAIMPVGCVLNIPRR